MLTALFLAPARNDSIRASPTVLQLIIQNDFDNCIPVYTLNTPIKEKVQAIIYHCLLFTQQVVLVSITLRVVLTSSTRRLELA